jgi:hypothetical protein
MITSKQFTLTAAILLCAGLLGLGMIHQGSHQSLVPTVQAQTGDSPFDRVRTRVCTSGVAEGRYGYTFNGTIVGVGTTTAVGVLTVDSLGNLSFADTQSINGQVNRRTFTGTYTINADCTGRAVFSTGLTGDFVLTDQGREIRVIITTSGTVISGEGKRL